MNFPNIQIINGIEYVLNATINQLWLPIPEYPEYEVSYYGEFRRIANQRPIKTFTHKNTGYKTITLSRNGIPKTFNAHRLVALAHIPNEFNLSDIDHIDGDKTNNSVQNLRWLSHKDNIRAYHNQVREAQRVIGEYLMENINRQNLLRNINRELAILGV